MAGKEKSIKIFHQNSDLMDSVKKNLQDVIPGLGYVVIGSPLFISRFHGHLEGVLRGTYMVLSYVCSELHRFQTPMY